MPNYKPYFLGPHSENEEWFRGEIDSILSHWFTWRKSLFASDPKAITEAELSNQEYRQKQAELSTAVEKLNELLRAEVPKYSPRYLGHMVSELTVSSLLGHFATLLHNPNNTAKEVSKVTSVIERQAINMLSEMVGYQSGIGHFTCGGTVANFEAMWRARFRFDHWLSLSLAVSQLANLNMSLFEASHMGWDKYNQLFSTHSITNQQARKFSLVANSPYPVAKQIEKTFGHEFLGPVLLIPGNKHFSWQKGTNLLGLGEENFWTIPLDENGHSDIKELEKLIFKARAENRPILMVVSVAGTTETGEFDPVDQVQDLLDRIHQEQGWYIWHHVDAAYGGFMASLLKADTSPFSANMIRALAAMKRVESITLDPHKLGYVPYSCGAFLARDERCNHISSFKAPYLDRPDLGAGNWSATIEGSRTGSGAVATWLTGKSIGFCSPTFSQLIGDGIRNRNFMAQYLNKLNWFRELSPADSNIMCFSVADDGDRLTVSNQKTREIFDHLVNSPQFSVSKTTLSSQTHEKLIKGHVARFHGLRDENELILIRCVFMNPFWSVEPLKQSLAEQFSQNLVNSYSNLGPIHVNKI